MNKLKIVITAIAVVALALSSCSTGGGSSGDDKNSSGSWGRPSSSGGKDSSSSDGENSSSSGGGSSSSSGGGGNGGTETYAYTLDDDGEHFTLFIPQESFYCEEGVLKVAKDTSDIYQYYIIENNILTLTVTTGDTVLFSGSGNELVGTWTRTKGNRDNSCEYYNDPYQTCKDGYDITKAVFTEDKVTITREECYTDQYADGYVNEWNGYTTNVKDCNTLEYSKDSEKITKTLSKTGEKISYKNKVVCEYDTSQNQQKAACKAAWDEYEDDDYESILLETYRQCQNENLPGDYTGYEEPDDSCYEDEDGESICDDEGSLGKIATKKPAAKAFKAKAKTSKLKPLLKKKK